METAGQIKKKLEDKIYKIRDIREALVNAKRKFQSPVWNSFQAILNADNEVVVNYVCCKFCQEIYKCTISNQKDNGTSNLLRHEKVCRARLKFISKKKEGK